MKKYYRCINTSLSSFLAAIPLFLVSTNTSAGSVVTVSEPDTLLLFGAAAVAGILVARIKRKK